MDPDQYAFPIDSESAAATPVAPVEGLVMGGAIGERTICCIAENVPADHPKSEDQIDCDFCGGNKAFRVIRDSVLIDTYSADPFLSGSLESYSFDGGVSVNLPQIYDTPYIDIPLPKKFDHLCLRYNNEGGANITVVAVDIGSGAGHKDGGKFRPKTQPAFGNDPACPIEKATLKKATVESSPDHDEPLLDLTTSW